MRSRFSLLFCILLGVSHARKPTPITQKTLLTRGGVEIAPKNILSDALSSLPKNGQTDTLLLLGTTAFNAPLCSKIKLSPILGLLLAGLVLGPQGLNMIADVHRTEHLADIGIVFFLFEMGIHLSLKTLWRMRTDVFGLGGAQFGVTAAVVYGFARTYGQSAAASLLIGGGLALSSSAFVLQLLKDKGQLETEYGQKSFGVLLLQDLMVVPLLVLTPILAPGSSKSLTKALGQAGLQILVALGIIGMTGTLVVPKALNLAAGFSEAWISLCVMVVLGFSFLTEGLGLSNTLGAFLAGVLMAESPRRHAIEEAVSSIRGILVGIFFFTVGFEINLGLIADQAPLVLGLAAAICAGKSLIAGTVARLFGVPTPTARHLGLVLSQGGEFAFVAFRTARSYGILDDATTQLLLTVVALTMAVTPMLEDVGDKMDSVAPPKRKKR